MDAGFLWPLEKGVPVRNRIGDVLTIGSVGALLALMAPRSHLAVCEHCGGLGLAVFDWIAERQYGVAG